MHPFASRLASLFVAMLVAGIVSATDGLTQGQTPATVDFARDIQPLLAESCVGCHGPSQQQAGYRLDRRSSAMRGVVRDNIVPGSGESSRLYRRIVGRQLGPQMPPTGALAEDQIDLIKRWIDEGAAWPDALANEAERLPPDPGATRMIEMIRRADAARLDQPEALRAVVNKGGPGGSTPLMYAAFYGDDRLVAEMLKAGGDPNLRNHAGATALMWSLEHIEIVQRLLDAGADVNAASDFGRRPLGIAAAQSNAARLVELLLARGAAPTAVALTAASNRGDVISVRLLLAAGARDTGLAATLALRANCRACFDAILAVQPTLSLRAALNLLVPIAGVGNLDAVAEGIAHGADVNITDDKSRPVLMRAAIVDSVPPETIQLLIDRGADVNAKNADGLTALTFAKRVGRIEIVDLLVKAGATAPPVVEPTPAHVEKNTVRQAVERSLPLLQRTAIQFHKKSGCVSCHHNSLTDLTMVLARQRGFTVDAALAREDLNFAVRDVETSLDQSIQGVVTGGGQTTTTGYELLGLAAERYPASPATDAMARLLRLSQSSDGRWQSVYRPPIEASEFTATAVSMRGIQLYGGARAKPGNDQAVADARSWLERSTPRNTEDRVFRLFGLVWAQSVAVRDAAIKDLVGTQRSDGGWAQLPSLQSDAYSTGQSLVALAEAGMRANDPVYRRGVQFLLKTQIADGSWLVKTRAHPSQIYFESGFPHGVDQYISAAGTNWATQALIRSLS